MVETWTVTNCFYSETMTQDRFLHILQFLCFADNSQWPDKGEEYDQLWIIGTVFDTLNKTYTKFYNPTEHLAVDEVTAKFKNRVIFRHTFQRKENVSATDDMTAMHATVRLLTSRVEGLGHNIFLDNLFSSPRLFDDLDRRKINSCRTFRPNRKDMPCDFGPKQNWKGVM